MNLQERLLQTNPKDFRPFDKAVEIAVALYEKGYLALPEVVEGVYDSGNNFVKIAEHIQIRFHKRGEGIEDRENMKFLQLVFDQDGLTALSGRKESLVLLSECLNIDIDHDKLNSLPQLVSNCSYKVVFDLEKRIVRSISD